MIRDIVVCVGTVVLAAVVCAALISVANSTTDLFERKHGATTTSIP